MKLVYFGDVVGKAGRTVLLEVLPGLIDRLSPDFVIVNGENAAHGFGITGSICEKFFDAGVDVITTGNHAWDQREIIEYIKTEPRLLRPLNYPENTPGQGSGVFEARDGSNVLVAQVMGRLFMDPLDDPFAAVDKSLKGAALGVDIHAEATSEKMSMGHYLDGRASMVVGTHSHVPTADAQILPGGTAYQTDIGMCGDYNSVIGMKKEAAIGRFLKTMPSERLEPAEEAGTACSIYLETDDATGLAKRVEPLRLGGRLKEADL